MSNVIANLLCKFLRCRQFSFWCTSYRPRQQAASHMFFSIYTCTTERKILLIYVLVVHNVQKKKCVFPYGDPWTYCVCNKRCILAIFWVPAVRSICISSAQWILHTFILTVNLDRSMKSRTWIFFAARPYPRISAPAIGHCVQCSSYRNFQTPVPGTPQFKYESWYSWKRPINWDL